MPTTGTPNILTDPGYLFRAPIGSAEPANTTDSTKFTDAWPVAWVSVGATEDGSNFKASVKTEPVMAAEFFDPIKYLTTERSSSISFAMADFTLTKLKWAMNGGALTVVAATAPALSVNNFEPPDPGTEVRSMIGWESLDGTARLICRQTFQGGEISPEFKKAPSKALIAVEFMLEVPPVAKPWKFSTAGPGRG